MGNTQTKLQEISGRCRDRQGTIPGQSPENPVTLSGPKLYENGDTFPESFLGSFWGFVCRQPPPANPFSKPPKICQKKKFFLFFTARLCRGSHAKRVYTLGPGKGVHHRGPRPLNQKGRFPRWWCFTGVHAKGVVLCERTCF